jgi:hypothetical protein
MRVFPFKVKLLFFLDRLLPFLYLQSIPKQVLITYITHPMVSLVRRLQYAPLVLKSALRARREYSKSLLSQLIEIMQLRFGPGLLGPTEYYEFGLFNDQLINLKQKKEFAGWRMWIHLEETVNDASWRSIVNDKFIFYSVMRGLNLATPETYAVFDRSGRGVQGLPQFNTIERFVDYLKTDAPFPFFTKPCYGHYGIGAFAIKAYNRHQDAFLLGGDDTVEVSEFIRTVEEEGSDGYLVQAWLRPDPSTDEILGGRLSTARFNILIMPDGPKIHWVTWKLPTGSNMTDNFHLGTTGNLAGFVDPETGRVLRVCGGVGFNLKEIEVHPDTGKPIVGITLPNWPRTIEYCLAAARCFPGLKVQHWDIAFTNTGPVALELNTYGGLDIQQYASSRGFMNENLQTFVRQLKKKK